MKLYDLITDFNEELLSTLPVEIQECIRNQDIFRNKSKNSEGINLEYIWEVTKKVCMPLIDKARCDSTTKECIGFLEDIKYYSIINIFLSIKSRSIDKMEPKSLMSLINEYYDICSKSFEAKDETRYKIYKGDKRDFYNNFTRKVHEWKNENSIRDMQSINWNSDFMFCFVNSLELGTEGINNIKLDTGIFFETIRNWKDSPYNYKHVYGMRFSRLKLFYEALENVIESKSNKIDKIITAYTIERLFNITFVYELASFLNEKFYEQIKQLKLVKNLINIIEIVVKLQNLYNEKRSIHKEDLSKAVKSTLKKEVASYTIKFIYNIKESEVNKIINTILDARKLVDIKKVMDMLKSSITMSDVNISGKSDALDSISSLAKKLEQILEQDKYKNNFLGEFLMSIKDANLNESHIRSSIGNNLCILADLVSLPMVFSRKKYMRSLYKLIEKCDVEDYRWHFKFRHRLYYMNAYLIPLISKVYYYFMFSSAKAQSRNDEETLNYVQNVLEEYIVQKEKIYDLTQITLNKDDDGISKVEDTSEGFQINLTEMIYNYQYEREPFSESIDVIEYFKKLDTDENIEDEILRYKYKESNYFLNFPYNTIYSVYYDKNNDIL